MLEHKQTYVLLIMVAGLALFTAGCKAGGQKSVPLAAGGYPPSLPAATAYKGDTGIPAPAVPPTPLPPVQQASTARQEYCPVTGAKLGSMGPPVPVANGSQTIYVCCAGCVEKLRQNPEQYLKPGVPTSPPNANYQPQQDSPTSSRTTRSASSQAGSCGSGSCCH